MNPNQSLAIRHAEALAKNYRTAHPTSSDSALADYVAEEMVGFVGRNRALCDRNVADDYDSWYAHVTLNFGSNR